MSQARELLREKFGFDEFRDGQEEVIGHLLAGSSAAAVFPTGSGKSLCYQLPSLVLPGLTLVVSPLIALMKDQIDQLKKRNIPAERLDSTLSADEVRTVMAQARSGDLRMLYVAPERFNNERFRDSIQQMQVSLFAVDEAHCISEWGHNFRPDYLKLAQFSKLCRAERRFALTATATPKVLEDICRFFDIQPECAIRTGFYRSNLTLLTTPMTFREREGALRERVARYPGPQIVYVTLQRTAEEVAEMLAQAGFSARPYHAGMRDEDRAEVQDWFLESDSAIVVATIAFGMGIDKPNIRAITHFNLPKSLENYSQEIGRSGRDGLPSSCEMFVCPDDLNTLENFIYGDTPGLGSVRGLLSEVFSQGDNFDVSLYDLSYEHDIRPLVISTLMTYLELDGYLEGGTPFYAKYRFQPHIPSREMESHFEGERREFLHNVFRQVKAGRTWMHIDAELAARAIGSNRERVVRALDYLESKGWMDVKAEGVRNRYRCLKRPDDPDELAEELYLRGLERENREAERLGQVLELAAHTGCQVSHLCEHFGEALDAPCGHCSVCLHGPAPMDGLERRDEPIDPAIWEQAQQARESHPDPLADPRAFSRFLCGLTSPRISRGKLTSHRYFGALSHVPFERVLAEAGGG